MKNLRLAIFVVGTTVMLWMGCSNRTYDEGMNGKPGYELVENESGMDGDSLSTSGTGTMDELDEVR
jgi:hypothetical protein